MRPERTVIRGGLVRFKGGSNTLAFAMGGLALAIISTGSAVAATGQVVNLADGSNPSHVAKVDASGHLLASVSGSVATHLATISNFSRGTNAVVGDNTTASCSVIYEPPTGKAAILRHLEASTLYASESGSSDFAALYLDLPGDAHCAGTLLQYVSEATAGNSTIPFDPGLPVPAGASLSAQPYLTGPTANFTQYTVTGYLVAPGLVPNTASSNSKAPARTVRPKQ